MICYCLSAVIVIQSIVHRAERRDLYDRITPNARKEHKNDGRIGVISAHNKVIDRWHGKGSDKNAD